MVVLGTGIGLTSAPATEAIMGVVPKAKAGVGSAVNDAASAAFFHGFHAANYLAAGVAAAGAVMALSLLPANPTAGNDDIAEVRALGSLATAGARS